MNLKEAMDLYFKSEDDLFVFNESSFKKKYRTLCKIYHPDNKQNSKSEEFLDIHNAYVIIKDALETYGNDYERLWINYKNNNKFTSVVDSHSTNTSNSNNTKYDVPDNLSNMIASILSSISILKGYIYKHYHNFNFPNDEYLADYLIKFKYPSKYDLKIEEMNLKSFINSLIKEINITYNINIYINNSISNFGVIDFYQQIEYIWKVLVEYEEERHKNRTIDDIKKDCFDILEQIEKILNSSNNIFDKIRFYKLWQSTNKIEQNLNIILKEIFYFICKYKLYNISEPIYQNNIQVINNMNLQDLPNISKMVSEWKDHINKNEISTNVKKQSK